MYEHVMIETLSGTFMAIWGVTYITCCYVLTLPLLEDEHLSFCVLNNVVLENHSVQNSPRGEGVYSQLKAYSKELLVRF